MSHQGVIGIRREGEWEGRHVQWLLPGWTLPEVTRELRELLAGGCSLREALLELWEETAEHTRFDRWPDLDAPRDGWGLLRSSDSDPIRYQHVILLDPQKEAVEVLRSKRCREHHDLGKSRAVRTGWSDRGGDAGGRCAFGVGNQVAPEGRELYPSAPAGEHLIRHPKHKVEGCECTCSGGGAYLYVQSLLYPAAELSVGEAIGRAAEEEGHEEALQGAQEAVQAGVAETWARLVVDGTPASRALELALMTGRQAGRMTERAVTVAGRGVRG